MNLNDYSIIMPAHIVEYFPDKQLATVRIANTTIHSNSVEWNVQTSNADLFEVPVYTSGGGGWHITFPIKPEDPCLLYFSQFGYDHWLFENKSEAGVRAGGEPQPWTKRTFSLADGFCQVGWNNIPTKIQEYQGEDAEFRNADRSQRVTLKSDGNLEVVTGTTKITLTGDSISVDSNSSVTVNTETANINALTEANITTATANIDATIATNIISPLTKIDGNLEVTGLSTLTGVVTASASVATPSVNVGGGAVVLSSSGATSTGPMSATEFTAGVITLTGHVHKENGDGGGITNSAQAE